MEQKKKVIVVGAGISGLVAGIYALKAGFDAEIYESHIVAGGECTGWERKGYPIDGCIHWLTGTQKGTDMYKIWETCGGLGNNIPLFNNDYIIAYKHNNETYYFYTDTNKLKQELLSISPDDEKEINNLIETIENCKNLPIPANKPNELLSDNEKAAFYSEYIKVGKYLEEGSKMTVHEYTKRFSSPIIRNMILAVIPENIMLTVLFFTLGTRATGIGTWPQGGSTGFSQRMKKLFEKMGGKMYLNSPVKRIVIENSIAKGIVLQKNEEFKTADYIVSGTDANTLLKRLLENKYKDNYFEYRFANPEMFPLLSATLISIGVNLDLKDRPHNLYFNLQKPVKINNTIHKVSAVQHHGYDTEFCKAGKTTLEVILNDTEYDYWKNLRNESAHVYKAEKERIAKEIIAEVENLYPEIKGHIEMVDVATPTTFHRYCSAYRGSYMGFVAIPGVKQENHKGVIDGVNNLYIAGQWVFPDGGLPMAAIAGKYAIQRICDKEKMEVSL